MSEEVMNLSVFDSLCLKRPTKLDTVVAQAPKPQFFVQGDVIPPLLEERPLEKKIPLLPIPERHKDTYTRGMLGEPVTGQLDADDMVIYDPYNYEVKRPYEPVHDPHLKPYFSKPINKEHLKRLKVLTKDNQVYCTLDEYNAFRKYLHKKNLRFIRKIIDKKEHSKEEGRLYKQFMCNSRAAHNLSEKYDRNSSYTKLSSKKKPIYILKKKCYHRLKEVKRARRRRKFRISKIRFQKAEKGEAYKKRMQQFFTEREDNERKRKILYKQKMKDFDQRIQDRKNSILEKKRNAALIDNERKWIQRREQQLIQMKINAFHLKQYRKYFQTMSLRRKWGFNEAVFLQNELENLPDQADAFPVYTEEEEFLLESNKYSPAFKKALNGGKFYIKKLKGNKYSIAKALRKHVRREETPMDRMLKKTVPSIVNEMVGLTMRRTVFLYAIKIFYQKMVGALEEAERNSLKIRAKSDLRRILLEEYDKYGPRSPIPKGTIHRNLCMHYDEKSKTVPFVCKKKCVGSGVCCIPHKRTRPLKRWTGKSFYTCPFCEYKIPSRSPKKSDIALKLQETKSDIVNAYNAEKKRIMLSLQQIYEGQSKTSIGSAGTLASFPSPQITTQNASIVALQSFGRNSTEGEPHHSRKPSFRESIEAMEQVIKVASAVAKKYNQTNQLTTETAVETAAIAAALKKALEISRKRKKERLTKDSSSSSLRRKINKRDKHGKGDKQDKVDKNVKSEKQDETDKSENDDQSVTNEKQDKQTEEPPKRSILKKSVKVSRKQTKTEASPLLKSPAIQKIVVPDRKQTKPNVKTLKSLPNITLKSINITLPKEFEIKPSILKKARENKGVKYKQTKIEASPLLKSPAPQKIVESDKNSTKTNVKTLKPLPIVTLSFSKLFEGGKRITQKNAREDKDVKRKQTKIETSPFLKFPFPKQTVGPDKKPTSKNKKALKPLPTGTKKFPKGVKREMGVAGPKLNPDLGTGKSDKKHGPINKSSSLGAKKNKPPNHPIEYPNISYIDGIAPLINLQDNILKNRGSKKSFTEPSKQMTMKNSKKPDNKEPKGKSSLKFANETKKLCGKPKGFLDKSKRSKVKRSLTFGATEIIPDVIEIPDKSCTSDVADPASIKSKISVVPKASTSKSIPKRSKNNLEPKQNVEVKTGIKLKPIKDRIPTPYHKKRDSKPLIVQDISDIHSKWKIKNSQKFPNDFGGVKKIIGTKNTSRQVKQNLINNSRNNDDSVTKSEPPLLFRKTRVEKPRENNTQQSSTIHTIIIDSKYLKDIESKLPYGKPIGRRKIDNVPKNVQLRKPIIKQRSAHVQMPKTLPFDDRKKIFGNVRNGNHSDVKNEHKEDKKKKQQKGCLSTKGKLKKETMNCADEPTRSENTGCFPFDEKRTKYNYKKVPPYVPRTSQYSPLLKSPVKKYTKVTEEDKEKNRTYPAFNFPFDNLREGKHKLSNIPRDDIIKAAREYFERINPSSESKRDTLSPRLIPRSIGVSNIGYTLGGDPHLTSSSSDEKLTEKKTEGKKREYRTFKEKVHSDRLERRKPSKGKKTDLFSTAETAPEKTRTTKGLKKISRLTVKKSSEPRGKSKKTEAVKKKISKAHIKLSRSQKPAASSPIDPKETAQSQQVTKAKSKNVTDNQSQKVTKTTSGQIEIVTKNTNAHSKGTKTMDAQSKNATKATDFQSTKATEAQNMKVPKPVNAQSQSITKTTKDQSKKPTDVQSRKPTDAQHKKPRDAQSRKPTGAQSKKPTDAQSKKPTDAQSQKPTDAQSKKPTDAQSRKPTDAQSKKPTDAQSQKPTDAQSKKPTAGQSRKPTDPQSRKPPAGQSQKPTDPQSRKPPAGQSQKPTDPQSRKPIAGPSRKPTDPQSRKPIAGPSQKPTDPQSRKPIAGPSRKPTDPQSRKPIAGPSRKPTEPQSQKPTDPQSQKPTDPQSQKPTDPQSQKPTDPQSENPGEITETPSQSSLTIEDSFLDVKKHAMKEPRKLYKKKTKVPPKETMKLLKSHLKEKTQKAKITVLRNPLESIRSLLTEASKNKIMYGSSKKGDSHDKSSKDEKRVFYIPTNDLSHYAEMRDDNVFLHCLNGSCTNCEKCVKVPRIPIPRPTEIETTSHVNPNACIRRLKNDKDALTSFKPKDVFKFLKKNEFRICLGCDDGSGRKRTACGETCAFESLEQRRPFVCNYDEKKMTKLPNFWTDMNLLKDINTLRVGKFSKKKKLTEKLLKSAVSKESSSTTSTSLKSVSNSFDSGEGYSKSYTRSTTSKELSKKIVYDRDLTRKSLRCAVCDPMAEQMHFLRPGELSDIDLHGSEINIIPTPHKEEIKDTNRGSQQESDIKKPASIAAPTVGKGEISENRESKEQEQVPVEQVSEELVLSKSSTPSSSPSSSSSSSYDSDESSSSSLVSLNIGSEPSRLEIAEKETEPEIVPSSSEMEAEKDKPFHTPEEIVKAKLAREKVRVKRNLEKEMAMERKQKGKEEERQIKTKGAYEKSTKQTHKQRRKLMKRSSSELRRRKLRKIQTESGILKKSRYFIISDTPETDKKGTTGRSQKRDKMQRVRKISRTPSTPTSQGSKDRKALEEQRKKLEEKQSDLSEETREFEATHSEDDDEQELRHTCRCNRELCRKLYQSQEYKSLISVESKPFLKRSHSSKSIGTSSKSSSSRSKITESKSSSKLSLSQIRKPRDKLASRSSLSHFRKGLRKQKRRKLERDDGNYVTIMETPEPWEQTDRKKPLALQDMDSVGPFHKAETALSKYRRMREQAVPTYYFDEIGRKFSIDSQGKTFILTNEGQINQETKLNLLAVKASGSKFYVDNQGRVFKRDVKGNSQMISKADKYRVDSKGRSYFLDKDGQRFILDNDGNVLLIGDDSRHYSIDTKGKKKYVPPKKKKFDLRFDSKGNLIKPKQKALKIRPDTAAIKQRFGTGAKTYVDDQGCRLIFETDGDVFYVDCEGNGHKLQGEEHPAYRVGSDGEIFLEDSKGQKYYHKIHLPNQQTSKPPTEKKTPTIGRSDRRRSGDDNRRVSFGRTTAINDLAERDYVYADLQSVALRPPTPGGFVLHGRHTKKKMHKLADILKNIRRRQELEALFKQKRKLFDCAHIVLQRVISYALWKVTKLEENDLLSLPIFVKNMKKPKMRAMNLVEGITQLSLNYPLKHLTSKRLAPFVDIITRHILFNKHFDIFSRPDRPPELEMFPFLGNFKIRDDVIDIYLRKLKASMEAKRYSDISIRTGHSDDLVAENGEIVSEEKLRKAMEEETPVDYKEVLADAFGEIVPGDLMDISSEINWELFVPDSDIDINKMFGYDDYTWYEMELGTEGDKTNETETDKQTKNVKKVSKEVTLKHKEKEKEHGSEADKQKSQDKKKEKEMGEEKVTGEKDKKKVVEQGVEKDAEKDTEKDKKKDTEKGTEKDAEKEVAKDKEADKEQRKENEKEEDKVRDKKDDEDMEKKQEEEVKENEKRKSTSVGSDKEKRKSKEEDKVKGDTDKQKNEVKQEMDKHKDKLEMEHYHVKEEVKEKEMHKDQYKQELDKGKEIGKDKEIVKDEKINKDKEVVKEKETGKHVQKDRSPTQETEEEMKRPSVGPDHIRKRSSEKEQFTSGANEEAECPADELCYKYLRYEYDFGCIEDDMSSVSFVCNADGYMLFSRVPRNYIDIFEQPTVNYSKTEVFEEGETILREPETGSVKELTPRPQPETASFKIDTVSLHALEGIIVEELPQHIELPTPPSEVKLDVKKKKQKKGKKQTTKGKGKKVKKGNKKKTKPEEVKKKRSVKAEKRKLKKARNQLEKTGDKKAFKETSEKSGLTSEEENKEESENVGGEESFYELSDDESIGGKENISKNKEPPKSIPELKCTCERYYDSNTTPSPESSQTQLIDIEEILRIDWSEYIEGFKRSQHMGSLIELLDPSAVEMAKPYLTDECICNIPTKDVLENIDPKKVVEVIMNKRDKPEQGKNQCICPVNSFTDLKSLSYLTDQPTRIKLLEDVLRHKLNKPPRRGLVEISEDELRDLQLWHEKRDQKREEMTRGKVDKDINDSKEQIEKEKIGFKSSFSLEKTEEENCKCLDKKGICLLHYNISVVPTLYSDRQNKLFPSVGLGARYRKKIIDPSNIRKQIYPGQTKCLRRDIDQLPPSLTSLVSVTAESTGKITAEPDAAPTAEQMAKKESSPIMQPQEVEKKPGEKTNTTAVLLPKESEQTTEGKGKIPLTESPPAQTEKIEEHENLALQLAETLLKMTGGVKEVVKEPSVEFTPMFRDSDFDILSEKLFKPKTRRHISTMQPTPGTSGHFLHMHYEQTQTTSSIPRLQDLDTKLASPEKVDSSTDLPAQINLTEENAQPKTSVTQPDNSVKVLNENRKSSTNEQKSKTKKKKSPKKHQ